MAQLFSLSITGQKQEGSLPSLAPFFIPVQQSVCNARPSKTVVNI
jgi:hypothetical protein